ncbi:NTP transferase domain-containing protein [Rhodococcus sp. NPDC059234]|uniref:nucleotidyltransferase family protein n=1 Tax=Rhodococcus sp. NPDC059234 TaxID=3346781 RepID=UPI00366CFEFE
MFVTGLVLAAGASRRLGRPKQLLPYRGATLLDASLRLARSCSFDQLLVTVPGSAEAIESTVDLHGATVVHCGESGSGCSTSMKSAVAEVDPRSDGIVLLLGDQPGIAAESVAALVARVSADTIGVCHYDNGRGHPLWLGRSVFGRLATLHGDKAVWKLFDSAAAVVVEVPVPGEVPADVDTWDEYRLLLDRDRDQDRNAS